MKNPGHTRGGGAGKVEDRPDALGCGAAKIPNPGVALGSPARCCCSCLMATTRSGVATGGGVAKGMSPTRTRSGCVFERERERKPAIGNDRACGREAMRQSGFTNPGASAMRHHREAAD